MVVIVKCHFIGDQTRDIPVKRVALEINCDHHAGINRAR